MSAASKKAKGAKPQGTTPRRRKDRGGTAGAGDLISITNHPRARHSVRTIKAWVGLAGFSVAFLLSMKAGVPLAQSAERALLLGITGYLVGWGCAVAVWRSLVVAEARARAEVLRARHEQDLAAAADAAAKKAV